MALKLATYGHIPVRFRRALGAAGQLVDLSSELTATASDGFEFDALILGDCDDVAKYEAGGHRVKLLCLYGTRYSSNVRQSLVAVSERVFDPYREHMAALADYSTALTISLLSKVVQQDPYVRSGMWVLNDFSLPLRRQIDRMRLGIAGVSEISGDIAARCVPFGMQIGVFEPSNGSPQSSIFPSIQALSTWANVLLLASEFRGEPVIRISRDLLQRLGRDGVLILLCGATDLDVRVIQEALEDGTIAGAAICLDRSRSFLDHPVFSAPNAIFAPNTAIHSQETLREIESAIGERLVGNRAEEWTGIKRNGPQYPEIGA
ncbi:NAD(P)-dependent oxidoreductase [Sinorhizobium meliloti]|uniref:NAD(P)-dependent oxidoreductase n=1 Tax=Rhizobium meliloti TaxID=382 RepID=UPI000FDC0317|nr:NAD(P)-dependent oxidoreductase [Sinorhizobium meliloti]RVM17889.1 hypothetical protein CN134_07575 [Sinorhizobium meliloti]RVO34201.1 hypothetical protein CN098_07150 [Sinorhizobium meliloti]